MTAPEPPPPTVRDLAAGLSSGAVSALEVTEQALARIERLDPAIRAWVGVDAERALRSAGGIDAARQAGQPLGRLAGIPTGLKDTIDRTGFATGCGSAARQGRYPDRDAPLVTQLDSEGAVILGKTVTSEMAIAEAGPTRNPADLVRTPGASSSGSAAAVAAGMVPFAIGTQTNGSTIRPAAFCGVVGFKPTLGLIPTGGVLPHSALLDHVGLFTRTADDAAIVLEAMTGGRVPVRAAPPATPRLAFIRGPSWSQAERSTQERLEAFTASCPQVIADIELPAEFDMAVAAQRVIMEADIARSLAADFRQSRGLMSDRLAGVIESGMRWTARDYEEALAIRADLMRRLDDLLAPFDAAITPAVTGEAGVGLENSGNPVFATLWTLTGVPAASLPLLKGPNGLPLGVQLVARQHSDGQLLGVAALLEAVAYKV